MTRFRSAVAGILGALLAAVPAAAQHSGAAAIGAAVDGLEQTARVLVIAAHPDDEDTQLITWLARGRQVETAYLSLTRGDGGQNLIGNELGEALGVIRTEELLAARRVDGGVQFFTRAFDFGFSKSAEETFRHWPRDSVLRDVVTVVRAFRPHVIVSVFSGTPRDGHGHHQAAGLLAREAYDLAGDTVRMPRAINAEHLPPWTPLKFYRGARFWPETATLSFNVGEFDPLLGRSYAEIAAESRSQHRSQGFGALQRRGAIMNQVRREHTRAPAPEDPAEERSIFDGIETSWLGRLRAMELPRAERERLARVPASLAAVRATSLRRPDSLVVRLGELRTLLATGGAEPYRAGLERASRALEAAAGVVMEAEVEREEVALGDSVAVRVTVFNRGAFPVRVVPEDVFGCRGGVRAVEGAPLRADSAATILPDSARSWRGVLCAEHDRPSEPWWLAEPREGSLFRFASTLLPEDVINRGRTLRAAVTVEHPSQGGLPYEIHAPVVRRFADPVRGDTRRPLAWVPRVDVLLDRTLEFAPAAAELDREVRVQLRSASTVEEEVRLRIELPAGLRTDSATRLVRLPPGATRHVAFRVRGRLPPGRATIRAVAENRGETFARGYVPIEFEHIRPQRLFRAAEIAVEAVEVRVPAGLSVGYVRGVGDTGAEALRQLGVDVTLIEPGALATAELRRFRTVVVGPRAYQSRPELVEHADRLRDFARGGGTLVVQYGQYEVMQPGVMPFPITIRRPHDRVTDEAAPVQILAPEHPLLQRPNRITRADFDGWVQERALYMPAEFDPAYTALLAMSDPGEPPNRGAILVAPYGRGTYVYTSLALFRQLPAGVPGAARLFVNLLAAGNR